MSHPHPNPLSTSRKVVFALVVLVLGLSIAELSLRTVLPWVGRATVPDHNLRDHLQTHEVTFDEDLGWRFTNAPDPALGISVNGFRHAEVLQDKPAGTFRAFVLGDSQAMGSGLSRDEAFSSVAERLLRQQYRRDNIEIINAAVPGYTSLQILWRVEKELLDWSPDLIIVDARTFDSVSDGSAQRSGHTLEWMTFHSRLVWTLRSLVQRVRAPHSWSSTENIPMEHRPVGWGNHFQLMELADEHGVSIAFMDYPVYSDHVISLCRAPDLPEGAWHIDTVTALEASGHGRRLFFDGNHMTMTGARIAGKAIADAIIDAQLIAE